jgi:hypothetical protein
LPAPGTERIKQTALLRPIRETPKKTLKKSSYQEQQTRKFCPFGATNCAKERKSRTLLLVLTMGKREPLPSIGLRGGTGIHGIFLTWPVPGRFKQEVQSASIALPIGTRRERNLLVFDERFQSPTEPMKPRADMIEEPK